MSVNLFDGFQNRITGEAFRCLSYNEEAFVFEWIVQPKGYIPFEHIHLNQDEIFHIKKGEIKMIMNGKVHIGRAGDTIVVPKGTRHIACNNKPEILCCVVGYQPGLDNYTFFQCFAGLTIDQDTDKTGQINIPKMLYFTKKMKAQCITRPTSIPAPVFNFALNFFFIVGRLLGWHKLFRMYTENVKIYSHAHSGNKSSIVRSKTT